MNLKSVTGNVIDKIETDFLVDVKVMLGRMLKKRLENGDWSHLAEAVAPRTGC
jgi:hypothetical protein